MKQYLLIPYDLSYTDFFKDINTKIDDEEDYNYINNFQSFNDKLNKKLTKKIDKYLQL